MKEKENIEELINEKFFNLYNNSIISLNKISIELINFYYSKYKNIDLELQEHILFKPSKFFKKSRLKWKEKKKILEKEKQEILKKITEEIKEVKY